MKLADLNLDILAVLMNIIKNEMTRADLAALVRTCRGLYAIGMRYLVRDVDIRQDDVMESFCASILRRPEYAPFIRDISWATSCGLTEVDEKSTLLDAFADVLDLSTNLNCLSLDHIEMLLEEEPRIADVVASRHKLEELYLSSDSYHSPQHHFFDMLNAIYAPIRKLRLGDVELDWMLSALHHLSTTLKEVELSSVSVGRVFGNPCLPGVDTLRLDMCDIPTAHLVATFPNLVSLTVLWPHTTTYYLDLREKNINSQTAAASWAAIPHIEGDIKAIWSMGMLNCRVTRLDVRDYLNDINDDLTCLIDLLTELQPMIFGLPVYSSFEARILANIGHHHVPASYIRAMEITILPVVPARSQATAREEVMDILNRLPGYLSMFKNLSHLSTKISSDSLIPPPPEWDRVPPFIRALLQANHAIGSIDLSWSIPKDKVVNYVVAERKSASGEREAWFGRTGRTIGVMHALQELWQDGKEEDRSIASPRVLGPHESIEGFNPPDAQLVSRWMS